MIARRVRLDSLRAGSRFRLPGLPIEGRLVKADREGGTSAVVEIWRTGEQKCSKTIVDRWGRARTMNPSAKRRLEWSCGTEVEVIRKGETPNEKEN